MQSKPTSPMVLNQLLTQEFNHRFWSKVTIKRATECWPWKGIILTNGYGKMNLYIKGFKEVTIRAHRTAWILHNRRDVPDGLFVLHSCIGNKICCNPRHLRPGTQSENLKDAFNQGRRVILKGEDHPFSTLTERSVREIRKSYSSGRVLQKELAVKFGVLPQTISRIIIGKRWGHIQ